MTTIAANLECMAADTLICGDGPICHTSKLTRIGSSVFGFAGDVYMALAWLQWYASPRRNPQTLYKILGDECGRSEISVMELSPSGIILWNGWGVPMHIREKFYAIGAGSGLAVMAMHKGSTPSEAVKEAAKHDENTDGVEEMWLLPPELVPKRKRRGK